jgi:hypothetical protein
MIRHISLSLLLVAAFALLPSISDGGTFILANLRTSDLGYSPFTGQIYAAVPDSSALNPNTLTPINPANAALGTAVPIGFDPTRVAVSSDGTNVFTVVGGRRAVQRYRLPTAAADQLFSVAGGPVFDDMYAIAGRPNAVVLHESAPGFSPPAIATVVYENAVLLPNQVGHGLGVGGPDIIAVDPADGTKAYGYQNTISSYDNVPMIISAAGIDTTSPATLQGVVTGAVGPIALTGDHLFTNQGKVYSLSLGFQVASFLGGELFTLDVNGHKLYTMTSSGTTKTLRAYSLDTLTLVGSDVFNGISGNPASLIRLGSDSMAFRTSADQVVILHSGAVPEPSGFIIAATLGFALTIAIRRKRLSA